MVDRLRRFANRPLSDADRPRLFAVAVAVIAAAAAVLALLDDGGSPRDDRGAAPAPVPAAASEPPFLAVAPAPAAAPSEESDPPAGSTGSPAQIAQSKRAARRFLAGYLPYTYGRGSPRRIDAAAPGLRSRLLRERPRVPVRERTRRPRLELLQSAGVGRERAHLVALVRDGKRRYSVRLELERSSAGWQVTDLGR